MSDRRQNARFQTLGLSTPFGEVLDISDSGVGVFRKGKVEVEVGDEVTVHVRHEQTEVQLIPLEQLVDLLVTGEIDHALVAATLWRMLFFLRAEE